MSDLIQLANAIQSFIDHFHKLSNQYGFGPSYKKLRYEYLDICCDSDAILNEVILGLVSDDKEYYLKFMKKNTEQASEVSRLINDYLIESVKELSENQ